MHKFFYNNIAHYDYVFNSKYKNLLLDILIFYRILKYLLLQYFRSLNNNEISKISPYSFCGIPNLQYM